MQRSWLNVTDAGLLTAGDTFLRGVIASPTTWGLTTTLVTELQALWDSYQTSLSAVQNKLTRTHAGVLQKNSDRRAR